MIAFSTANNAIWQLALDRNCKMLREVRAALSRIDAGMFGICLGCYEDISMKRLAAMPWTADAGAGQYGRLAPSYGSLPDPFRGIGERASIATKAAF